MLGRVFNGCRQRVCRRIAATHLIGSQTLHEVPFINLDSSSIGKTTCDAVTPVRSLFGSAYQGRSKKPFHQPLWNGISWYHGTRADDDGGGSERAVGCFAGVAGVHEAGDWEGLAVRTEEACRGLIDDVIMSDPGPDVVRKLDEISDVLCRTMDAAEFCRHVHGEEVWRQAAHVACVRLGGFVQELNTHVGLYSALCRALDTMRSSRNINNNGSSHEQKDVHDDEYMYVGEMLKRDFERFGVHLEGKEKDDMTELIGSIHNAGHAYMKNTIDGKKTGEIVVDERACSKEVGRLVQRDAKVGLDAVFQRDGMLGDCILRAPGDSRICHGILWHCDVEEVRKAAYKTYASYPRENAGIAREMLHARRQVADIMGYSSFAAYQLDGFSLGNTPEAIGVFLKEVNSALKESIAEEKESLLAWKMSLYQHGHCTGHEVLQPWDRDWGIQQTLPKECVKALQSLGDMVTVPGFLLGMSALMEQVMNVRLVVRSMMPGESWADGVIKVCAYDSRTDEKFGTVYMDLFQRPGKFGGAALFTLQCGRQGVDGVYQLPKAALVANLSSDRYLSFGDLETLCHEFGHAMHSILSRTRLQHLSGTRGPQDIIEVPSHVFERFASHPVALELMAKHSGKGYETVPSELMNNLSIRKKHCAALKLQNTIETCLLDQYMHSERVGSDGFGTAEDLEHFMMEHGVEHYGGKSYPPLRFSHLVGYAGNYYSYLFANCIASQVWDGQYLEEHGMPSTDVMHRRMLACGGSKPAKAYVEDLFTGDTRTSALVGVKGSTSDTETRGYYPDFHAYLRDMDILRYGTTT